MIETPGTNYSNKLLEELGRCACISEDQFQQLRLKVEEGGVPFFSALAMLNLDSSQEVCQVIASALDIAYIDVDNFEISSEDLEIISREIAHRHKVLPLFRMDSSLTLGMADPTDTNAIDIIRDEVLLEVEPCLVSRPALERAVGRYYPEPDSTFSDIADSFDASQYQLFEADTSSSTDTDDMAPIAKAFSEIVIRAVRTRASDIHIEPSKDSVRIRCRIDGVLHEISKLPGFLIRPLVSHVKVLCQLHITETRRPHDGRYQAEIDGREVDMRVSIIPTIFGESVVIRLLGVASQIYSLNDLGFSPGNLKAIEKILYNPWGMVLASGPTGSGKTTTLFALLERIKSREKKIITVEDPVEFKDEDISQIQVNTDVGLTFASGLRSILRQDPDIVMVGEIRDTETAAIATQAALTGHFVLSTLHTNDAASAVARLMDMEIQPFLISSALTGVLGQRLVRRICPHCIEESKEDVRKMLEMGVALKENEVSYIGAGCARCFNTGYIGRVAVAEVLVVSDEIRRRIMNRASSNEIRSLARKEGMTTLIEEGINSIVSGATSLSEVARAIGTGFEAAQPVEV